MTLVVYAVVASFMHAGVDASLRAIESYRPPPAQRLDFLTAVGLSIGFFSVPGVVSPDYASHCRTRLDAVLGSVFGLLPPLLASQ